MKTFAVRIDGAPVPQGSKNAYQRNGRIVLVESAKNLKPYRASVTTAVAEAAAAAGFEKVTRPGAVHLHITFHLQRPKSNRNTHHTVKPDIDKLCRTILDGITAAGSVYEDDSQVVTLAAEKQYSDASFTFVMVTDATA